jgi:hypothetical protein
MAMITARTLKLHNLGPAKIKFCLQCGCRYLEAVGIQRLVQTLITYAHIVNLTKETQISHKEKCYSENLLTNYYS